MGVQAGHEPSTGCAAINTSNLKAKALKEREDADAGRLDSTPQKGHSGPLPASCPQQPVVVASVRQTVFATAKVITIQTCV